VSQASSIRLDESGGPTHSLLQQSRLVRILTRTDFKLRYGDSALGYVWTLIKPLAMFGVLYVVFGSFFKFGTAINNYPLFLLIGIVLWSFFADATSSTMMSIVSRSELLHRLSFPVRVIPVAATMTALISFAIDFTMVGFYVGWSGLVPQLDWFALLFLVGELTIFVLGLSLILATVYSRLTDVRLVWELVLTCLFYATPIFYSVGQLPSWAQKAELVNPFAQIVQDVRSIILYHEPAGVIVTAGDTFGWAGRLVPLGLAAAIVVIGFLIFRHDEQGLAERT
jgi:ABC-2 type transport system permease protein